MGLVGTRLTVRFTVVLVGFVFVLVDSTGTLLAADSVKSPNCRNTSRLAYNEKPLTIPKSNSFKGGLSHIKAKDLNLNKVYGSVRRTQSKIKLDVL